jgi:hypothetical protein
MNREDNMPFKQIITAVLLLFVVASVVFLIMGTGRKAELPENDITAIEQDRSTSGEYASDGGEFSSSEPADISGHSVVAYYFHGTRRCPTCMKIESYTKESIMEGFPQLIESGRLRFRAINVDETENGHFIDDYRLTMKSVVISDRLDGKETRWKNLNLVWEYVREKETFIDYVRRETAAYLGELEYE